MQMNEDKIKQFWNKRAKLYNKIPLESISLFVTDKTAQERDLKFKQLLSEKVKPNLMVLDLGCGVGNYTKYLAPICKEIWAVDNSEESIKIAKIECKPFDRVYFICEDISEFIFPEKFDIILISGVLHYLNDDKFKETIHNISKLINKNGHIYLKETIKDGDGQLEIINKYVDELDDDYNSIYRCKNWIKYIFEINGFKLIESKKFYKHRIETTEVFFDFEYIGIRI